MCERKPWTEKEDQTLKELKQVRNISRWSQISRIMKEEFQIFGRNGKQCRERYHNHLDSRISKQKWTINEQKKLLNLHNQWGNRWAAISRELPGRTDNCVKNHFYSCFRKCIKLVNSQISNNCKRKIRPIKLAIIHKIVTIIQSFHKDTQNFDKKLYEEAKDIKNQILGFSQDQTFQNESKAKILENLVKKISDLNKISRNKVLKRKKIKIESDFSQQLPHDNLIDPSQFNHTINEKQTIQVKFQNIITQQDVKVQASMLLRDQNQVKQEQNCQNRSPNMHMHMHMHIQMTPKKQKKQQKQKNSSYYALNSVDYLDVKHYPSHDIRDFINMDQQKQWKLYFQ